MRLHRIGDAGAMAFTPGILPYALDTPLLRRALRAGFAVRSGTLPSQWAGFAVRTAPAVQWLLFPTNRLERFEPP